MWRYSCQKKMDRAWGATAGNVQVLILGVDGVLSHGWTMVACVRTCFCATAVEPIQLHSMTCGQYPLLPVAQPAAARWAGGAFGHK